MAAARLLPFAEVVKGRDVEDPINRYFNRVMAYAFVAVVYRTPLTPNMVTLLATLVGIGAGACWLEGSPGYMLLGGVLLWTSAILDGADGILARTKDMASKFGRAIDGAADMIVAIATVLPAFWHMWVKHQELWQIAAAVPVVFLTIVHIKFYDFYKLSYLFHTRPEKPFELEDVETIRARAAAMTPENTSLVARLAMNIVLVPHTEAAWRYIERSNPLAAERLTLSFPERNARSGEIYRAHNRGPMQMWIAVSLAPHTYLLAICGMFDRIDLYLWFRLVGANVLWVIAMLWQRRATRRTLEALEAEGILGPST